MKNHMVIIRFGAYWTYYAPRPELFTKQDAEAYAATIDPKHEPRVVTAAEYLQICQSFKEAA